MSEGFIETAPGIRLYYTSTGDGPQTVLIPVAAWTADFDVLARGRRIVRYDSRGRGRSSAIAVEQSSFDDEVADLERLRDALGLGRVALIGWSYFGGVVMRYAMLHPERVERVISIGGMPAWRAGWAEQMQKEYMDRLAALPADVKQRQVVMEVFRHTRMGRDPVRPFPDLSAIPNEQPGNVMALYTQAMKSLGDWDWRKDATALRVPALIVHGTADLCPGAAREWAELLPAGQLLMMEGVGHVPALEDPEMFFAEVEKFLTIAD